MDSKNVRGTCHNQKHLEVSIDLQIIVESDTFSGYGSRQDFDLYSQNDKPFSISELYK